MIFNVTLDILKALLNLGITWIIHERNRKTQRRKEYWYSCSFATKRTCFLSQARLHCFYSFASLGFAVYELFRIKRCLKILANFKG